jgi:hypothetical protein
MASGWWISSDHFNALKPNTDSEPDAQIGADRFYSKSIRRINGKRYTK